MKASLVRIGNSRGVRIPKPLLVEAGLPDDVDLRAEDGTIVIAPARRVRSGWEEAARRAHAAGDDVPLAETAPTRFDEDEWQW